MRRAITAAIISMVAALALAQAAMAAGPAVGGPRVSLPAGPPPTQQAAPSDGTVPGEEPHQEDPSSAPGEPPAPTDAPEGSVVFDPPFVTPTPDGTVLGAVGTPSVTPPPTDRPADVMLTRPASGATLALLVLAGLSVLALLVGRTPAARRG